MSAEMQPIPQAAPIRFPVERARPTTLPIEAPVCREVTTVVQIRKVVDVSPHDFYQEKPKEIRHDKQRQALVEKRYQKAILESGRKPSGYDPYFDQLYYQLLREEYGGDEYTMKCEQLREGRLANIDTFLGERLHVGISSYEATIVNQEIVPVGWPKSLLTMIEEGREYRRNRDVCLEDQRRELAESTGMGEVIQPGMAQAEEDDIIVSVSPPSGTYHYNFYDMFIRTKTGVQVKRFTGGLSLKEYQEKTAQFYEGKAPDSQVDFLRAPFLISGDHPLKDPEKLHAYLHADHGSLSIEAFEKVKKGIRPLAEAYFQYLERGEHSLDETELYINAIANKADEIAGIRAVSEQVFDITEGIASRSEIVAYGHDPRREVLTACDPRVSGGGVGAWGVADFVPMAVRIPTPFGSREELMTLSELRIRYVHQDQHEARYFQCGSCGVYNVRPEGQLLPNCLGCKASAQCETKKETEENSSDLAA